MLECSPWQILFLSKYYSSYRQGNTLNLKYVRGNVQSTANICSPGLAVSDTYISGVHLPGRKGL